jgi:hypothetical protein
MTDLTIFRDGERYIIAPKAQIGFSQTDGLWEAYSKRQALKLLAEARAMTDDEIKANIVTFWTNERFETACDAGHFGAAW